MQLVDDNSWRQPLTKGVTVALILLLIWLTVKLFWALLSPQDVIPDLSLAPTVAEPPPAAEQISLAQYHLFGEYQAAPVLAQFRNAPETPLNLELRGIVAAADPQQGFAIIRDSRGREGVYRAGTELENNAQVKGVYPDRVVLLREGRYETLRLPGAGNSESESTLAASRPVAAGNESAPRPLTAAIPQARDLLTVNLASLANSYRLVPVPQGGYRLTLGRNARQLVDLGLRHGDILIAANGVSLDDRNSVQAVINEILNGRQLNLQINRSGEILMLQPDLSAIIPK